MLRDFADAIQLHDEAVQQADITLKSKPVNVTVKPLPEVNKPSHFKGAVGNFKINASA